MLPGMQRCCHNFHAGIGVEPQHLILFVLVGNGHLVVSVAVLLHERLLVRARTENGRDHEILFARIDRVPRSRRRLAIA